MLASARVDPATRWPATIRGWTSAHRPHRAWPESGAAPCAPAPWTPLPSHYWRPPREGRAASPRRQPAHGGPRRAFGPPNRGRRWTRRRRSPITASPSDDI